MIAEAGAYAIIPDWVLLATISAQAVRLYGVLRLAADNQTLRCAPSRQTLAERLQCASPKPVDRALTELSKIGAVTVVARRTAAGDPDTNGYVLHRTPWGRDSPHLGTPASLPRDASVPTPPRPAPTPVRGRDASVPTPSENGHKPAVPRGVGTPASPGLQKEPPPSGGPPPTPGEEPNGGAVVKAWIDRQQRQPPRRVVGQVAQRVGQLLREGFAAADLDAALARMDDRHLGPTMLDSMLNDVVNGSTHSNGGPYGRRSHAEERPQWQA